MPRKSLFVLLLTLLCLPVEGMDRGRILLARAKIEKGQSLLKQSKYEHAERAYRAAIEYEPTIPTGYLGLGAALVGQEKFKLAVEVLSEAEQRFVAWELMVTAVDLQRQQVTERQLRSIREIAAAAALTNRVGPGGSPQQVALLNQNKISKEQFLVRERWPLEGIETIPAQVFYLEGIAYLRSNRPVLGIEALETCLLIDKAHGLANYNLAVALFSQGQYTEANDHLQLALKAGVEPHPQFVLDLEGALG